MKSSMFDEFKDVLNDVRNGDKESAMIILQKMPWGENKHAMVGDLINQITLLEWGIHMIADGSNCSFEKIMNLIEIIHKETDHYMLNVHKEELNKKEND